MDKRVKFMKNFDNAYMSDNQSFEKKGAMMLQKYAEATKEEQEAMDSVLINLCGYSFDTLLNEKIEKETIF